MRTIQTLILVLLASLHLACTPERREVTSNEWIALSLSGINGDSSSNPPAEYILRFPQRRSFSIQLDVNSCGGTVQFQPNNVILFNGIGCTEACCDSEFATRMLAIMGVVNRFQFNNDQLIMLGNAGEKLVFQRK
jgi:hypothetical protein